MHNPKDRGEFWIYYTLIEGSLESYITVLCEDKVLLSQHYCETALLRLPCASASFVILVAALCQLSLFPLDSVTKVGLSLVLFTEDIDSNLSSPSQDSGIGDTGRSQEDVSFFSSSRSDSPSSNCTPPLSTAEQIQLPRSTEIPSVRLRKRVSWHETVSDSKERPIWERRSWNCEEYGGGPPPEESGVEATERGAPEGSEDPQAFSETLQRDACSKPDLPKKNSRVRKKWGGLPPGPEVKDLSSETDILIKAELGCAGHNRSRGNKLFRLLDLDGEPVLCALTESDVCLVSLINHSLNIQRIPYVKIETVEVGPSDEEICLEGRKLVSCFRGAEFCSHLDVALRRVRKCEVDFVRLHISNSIQEKMKSLLYCFVAVMGKNKIEDEREELLMCRFDKHWFPATVVLKNRKLSLKWDRGEKEWALKECISCERLSQPRPHSFRLRFSKGENVILAASSDQSVSLWMQGILSSLSQSQNVEKERDEGLEMVRIGLGENAAWILSVPQANIKASLPLAAIACVLTAASYIILELGCHEAVEGGADWVLYFLSPEMKEIFLSSLLVVKPQLKEMVFPHNALIGDTSECELIQAELARKHARLQEYIESV